MCLGVPGQVVEIFYPSADSDSSGAPQPGFDKTITLTGKVSFGGTLKKVSLAYVPHVKIGDYVIVHVGFAISILNEAEAKSVYSLLDEGFSKIQ